MEGRASKGKVSFSLGIPGHDLAVTRPSLILSEEVSAEKVSAI